MYCVCYICCKQYRVKPPVDDLHISHAVCEKCFPGELLGVKREAAAFRTSAEHHSVSERNRHFPKGFDARDLF